MSNLARLCALYGARVLVVDLAQPGTATTSLRDIFPDGEFGELSGAMLSFQRLAPGARPDMARARAALEAMRLPILLQSQPSWSGGFVAALPWDELLGDAAAQLPSNLILRGLLDALAGAVDVVLMDFPAEGGPLLTNALAATDCVIVPLVPETPALEGLETTLRLLARGREAGHAIRLGGILLTRCDPKNKRAIEIVQTLRQSGEVEGEPLGQQPFGSPSDRMSSSSRRTATASRSGSAAPTPRTGRDTSCWPSGSCATPAWPIWRRRGAGRRCWRRIRASWISPR